MKIEYRDSQGARRVFGDLVREAIETGGFRDICDIGGGRNPLFSPEEVTMRNLNFSLLDISQEELSLAPDGYLKVCADIGGPQPPAKSQYDFVFSRFLAEHVSSGEQFYRNTFEMLKPGGEAFHFYPTLFALPFVVNKLMPERLADKVLNIVSPRDRQKQGKFPAYYSWCFGPTPSQIKRLEEMGFEILSFVGMYNHGYYKRIPPLHALHQIAVKCLLRWPNPYLTSFAFVHLRRN